MNRILRTHAPVVFQGPFRIGRAAVDIGRAAVPPGHLQVLRCVHVPHQLWKPCMLLDSALLLGYRRHATPVNGDPSQGSWVVLLEAGAHSRKCSVRSGPLPYRGGP